MPEVTCRVSVNAPPARVFEVFTDLANAAENVRGIRKLELLTPGSVGRGTRFRETRVMLGREATEEMEITDFRPGESYSVGAQSHGARYSSTLTFRPDGEGTLVQMRFSATPLSTFAKVMGLMSGLMMGSCRKMIQQDLDDLKHLAEAGVSRKTEAAPA